MEKFVYNQSINAKNGWLTF